MNEKKIYTRDEVFKIVATFLTLANTMELAINHMLEQIILEYKDNFESKGDTDEIIDFIQEQSVRTRINHIILFLSMTKATELPIREVMKELKKFAKYYNKNIRSIRDFIAHNTFLTGKETKLVSSRRFKGKQDSIKIDEIEKAIKDITPKSKELFTISTIIAHYYKSIIVRDIS
jgi:hypothetical protein